VGVNTEQALPPEPTRPAAKRGPGRPVVVDDVRAAVALHMASLGLSDSRIASSLGINRKSLAARRRRDPAWAAAVDTARAGWQDRLRHLASERVRQHLMEMRAGLGQEEE
jgi:hypothetical protein